jgi:hypothetical protein
MRGRAMGRARGVGQGAVAGVAADGPFGLNPAFWWRGDNLTDPDATPLATLVDQSVNGHILLNQGANNATIEDGIAGTNNKRYFKAPAGNVTCEYEKDGVITASSKGVTLFVALYFGTANPEAGTHRYLQVATERLYMQIDQNNDDLESYSDDAVGGCNINVLGATGMKICGLRWETATGSNNGQRLYLNSLTAGSTFATVADTTLTGTSLTVLNDRGNSQVFTELLAYDSALSDADFATVMNGLGTYYGVTIT